MCKCLLFVLLVTTAAAGQSGSPDLSASFKVNTAESTIAWTGRKVTGQHNGSLAIKEGMLKVKDGNLVGGSFIMDMTSITDLDLDGSGKSKLENHLKSDDFFGVELYPTSSLTITKVISKGGGQFGITADLTIKGITNPVNFDVQWVDETKQVIARTVIIVDRTLYNVRYGSGKFFDGLGDKVIYDEFELTVKLIATPN